MFALAGRQLDVRRAPIPALEIQPEIGRPDDNPTDLRPAAPPCAAFASRRRRVEGGGGLRKGGFNFCPAPTSLTTLVDCNLPLDQRCSPDQLTQRHKFAALIERHSGGSHDTIAGPDSFG